MRIDTFYRIRYTEDDFPPQFYDEDENLVATDREIVDWAKIRYLSDITDIINNDVMEYDDIKTRIKRDA